MKCSVCQTPMVSRKKDHHYVESGLNNVYLRQIPFWICSSCGEEELAIPDLEQLHDLIAQSVASKPTRLKPEEIRFLRVHLGFSGVDFARLISVKPETVSRWENNPKHEMTLTNEKLLRVMILAKLKPFDDYDTLSGIGEGKRGSSSPRLHFATSNDGWIPKAA